MKILHVVTYISPDGAYGGPVRVAVNQAKALNEIGQNVIVVATAGGFKDRLPKKYDGVPVKLFRAHRVIPKMGFAGLASPRLLAWLIEAIKAADVVHVHLARDLVTIPAAVLALLLDKPLVVQTHGMIDHTNNPLAAPLDKMLTRPLLRRAKSVLCLTDAERRNLKTVAGSMPNFTILPNGVVVSQLKATEQKHGPQPEPEVIFLARMHARKRPHLVVRAASKLQNRWLNARFVLIGPDEGEAGSLLDEIGRTTRPGYTTWAGALPPAETSSRMVNSSLFVLPSVNEPFGMSVIEAMALGIPVIVTDSCGLAPMIREQNAGIVCGPSQANFTAAVDKLLANPTMRLKMGTNGRAIVQSTYSMNAVTERLVRIYREAVKE